VRVLPRRTWGRGAYKHALLKLTRTAYRVSLWGTPQVSRCTQFPESRFFVFNPFPGVARHSNPGICSVRVFCGIQIPELVELFILKSRTETDARKKVSVIFVLISRTNFSRNFVRVLCATNPGFQCSDNAVKSRKRIENKQAYLGITYLTQDGWPKSE